MREVQRDRTHVMPGEGDIKGGSRTELQLFTLQKPRQKHFYSPCRCLGLCQQHGLYVVHDFYDPERKQR